MTINQVSGKADRLQTQVTNQHHYALNHLSPAALTVPPSLARHCPLPTLPSVSLLSVSGCVFPAFLLVPSLAAPPHVLALLSLLASVLFLCSSLASFLLPNWKLPSFKTQVSLDFVL